MNSVQIPRELLESVFEDLCDLRSEKDWTKDEPRRGYADKYNELVSRIQQVKDLLEPQLTPEEKQEAETLYAELLEDIKNGDVWGLEKHE